MNSEIIAVAFGAKCGLRACRFSGRFSPGLAGTSPSSLSPCSRWASAKVPMPKALRLKNSRRVGMRGSVHMEELVGGHQLLTQVRQRHQLGISPARRPQALTLAGHESTGQLHLVVGGGALIRQ